MSAGYLNKPELTAEGYLPDPFIGGVGCSRTRLVESAVGARMVNWSIMAVSTTRSRCGGSVSDGVSAIAETAAGVEKAVVLKIGTDLVTYETHIAADEDAVKKAVAKKLPYYCVPAKVFRLNELPETGNGKVRRKSP